MAGWVGGGVYIESWCPFQRGRGGGGGGSVIISSYYTKILQTQQTINNELSLTLMFSPAAQVPRLNFVPTPEFPALQYFGEVEKGRQADLQRVKSGDFILEVSIKATLPTPCKPCQRTQLSN